MGRWSSRRLDEDSGTEGAPHGPQLPPVSDPLGHPLVLLRLESEGERTRNGWISFGCWPRTGKDFLSLPQITILRLAGCLNPATRCPLANNRSPDGTSTPRLTFRAAPPLGRRRRFPDAPCPRRDSRFLPLQQLRRDQSSRRCRSGSLRPPPHMCAPRDHPASAPPVARAALRRAADSSGVRLGSERAHLS